GDRERSQCGYPGWCLAGPTTGDAGSSVEAVPHHLDPSPLWRPHAPILASLAERVAMRHAMIRVFACNAAVLVAFLVSGCGTGSLTETEQQSLAAAPPAAPQLHPGE